MIRNSVYVYMIRKKNLHIASKYAFIELYSKGLVRTVMPASSMENAIEIKGRRKDNSINFL